MRSAISDERKIYSNQTCIGKYFKLKKQSNRRRNDAMGYEMFAIATATLLVRAAASPDWIGQNFQQLREKTLLEITLPGSHNSGNYQGGLHTDVLLGFIFFLGEVIISKMSQRWSKKQATIKHIISTVSKFVKTKALRKRLQIQRICGKSQFTFAASIWKASVEPNGIRPKILGLCFVSLARFFGRSPL